MPDRPDNLDPVERLLHEFREAEHAGLFERTSISPTALDDAGSPSLPAWVLHLRRRWVPVAAALALAVTAWGFLFRRELNRLHRERATGRIALSTPDAAATDEFAVRCLSGPGELIDDRCRSYDLDTDGQVTLADFRKHQLAMVVHTR